MERSFIGWVNSLPYVCSMNGFNRFYSCLNIDETSKDFNKIRRRTNLNKYIDIYMNAMLSMFFYSNMPDSLPTRELERCLNEYGVACVIKNDTLLYVGVPALYGELDQYGYGTSVQTVTRNGKTLSGIVGKDCVLIWNNLTRTPNFDIIDTCLTMTDIDTSINSLVLNARAHKLPIAKNNKMKETIDTALSNVINGTKSYTVVNDIPLVDEINGKESEIHTLELTNPDLIDTVQYLSKLHDDILRRKTTMYGHALNTTGKMAQQTIEELNGYDSISMIIPEQMLECRREGIEQVNKMFNLNITVDYSLPWRYKLYKQDSTDTGVTPPGEVKNTEQGDDNDSEL